MKTFFVGCLVFIAALGPAAPLFAADATKRSLSRNSDDCQRGLEDAQLDAETVGGGNFWGGFALGLVFGPFGALGAPLLAGPSQPSYLLASQESDKYKNCYQQVYFTATKYRKKNKALIGGIIGFAVWGVLVAAAADNN